jgi:hypothetical protein
MKLLDFMDYFRTWDYKIVVLSLDKKPLMDGSITQLIGDRVTKDGADIKRTFERIVDSFYVHNGQMLIYVK